MGFPNDLASATNAAVVIAGAGPTGLAAALFLARRGIAVRIVDAAPQPSVESRALAVNSRTLDMLQDTGVSDRIVTQGWSARGAILHQQDKQILTFDLPTRLGAPRALTVLPQARTEALLTEALRAQGVNVERGVSLQSLAQDEREVTSTLLHRGGQTEQVKSRLLLGADGARHPSARTGP